MTSTEIILSILVIGLAIALYVANRKRKEFKQKYQAKVMVERLRVDTLSRTPRETTLTAIYEMNYKRMDEWREELCAHYRTDLTDVSTAWHICKLDENCRAVYPINIPADIAVKLFAKMSNHLYRKLERHKFSMKKGPDRFEYDGENFRSVIENGKVTVTDKETGKVIERK